MTNFINEILQLIITANKNKSLQYHAAVPKLWNKFPAHNLVPAILPEQNSDLLMQFFGFKRFR
ncbi:hypothetical protein SAMN05660293_02475 [Dyadobacter psychrophilus]|uniref:Uncharacterized protein n=1 Tax=Dyadobacter psychrophilus TaxID=651661 RepID=A0A1T5EI18_9BACT|nr:hypothetical protein SAMN05660293_02475 [Dyadobacter psychrophilus]